MGLREAVQTAIDRNGCATGFADAAIAGVREFVRRDTHAAHAVAQFTSLRQAASETPIQFVQRIVSAYLAEAVEMDGDAVSEPSLLGTDADNTVPA